MISTDDLENIKWSDRELPLSEFVNTYTLPQIVQISYGYDDGTYENSLSSGDVLKLHQLTTEWKLLCRNQDGKKFVFPIRDQKIQKKLPNIGEVFQRVSELVRANPIPQFVATTFGYSRKEKGGQEITFNAGDILEVAEVNHTKSVFSFKNRTVTFRNKSGKSLKVPYDCSAGFKVIEDCRPHSLADVIQNHKTDSSYFPFEFTFVDRKGQGLGVLQASSVREDHLIMASMAEGENEIIFMIPQKLPVEVQIAIGTETYDSNYESVKDLLSNYESLEHDFKSSEQYQELEYCPKEVGLYSIVLPNIPAREPLQSNCNAFTSNQIGFQENAPRIYPRTGNIHDCPSSPTKPAIPKKPVNRRKSNKDITETNLDLRKSMSELKLAIDTNDTNNKTNLPSSTNSPFTIDIQSDTMRKKLQPKIKSKNGEQSVSNQTKITNSLITNFEENRIEDNFEKTSQQNVYEPLRASNKEPSVYEVLKMDIPEEEENDKIVSIEEIKKMNIEKFIQVLRLLHMDQHVKSFVDNQVNGSLFCELDEDELKDLGLSKFEVKKLLRFKNGWRPT